MLSTLRLTSVPNFRDIAGPGYATPHGPMRQGRIFRANAFQVVEHELKALGTMGIVAIHDMRGQREVDHRPDVELPGATWVHACVPGLASDVMLSLETADDLRDAMIAHYRGFVRDPAKRAGFAAVLAGLAARDGSQVFHCAEGKDRTGWAAMLLQRLVGVSEDDILADFLLTNELMSSDTRTLASARKFFGDRPDEFFAPAMFADPDYLAAGMEELDAEYGDVASYLSRGLGLDDEQLVRLRDHLVAP